MSVLTITLLLIAAYDAWRSGRRSAYPFHSIALAANGPVDLRMCRIAEDSEPSNPPGTGPSKGHNVGTAGGSATRAPDGDCDDKLDDHAGDDGSGHHARLTAALAEAEAELALMRIEIGELRAHVTRLESGHPSATDTDDHGTSSEDRAADPADEYARAHGGESESEDDARALRSTLARRERTALDLKKRLKQSEQRVRELKLTLRSWKHRVAPLAQQLNLQRELIRELRSRENNSSESEDLSCDESRLQ